MYIALKEQSPHQFRFYTNLYSLEPNNGEHNDTSKYGGPWICKANYQSVNQWVVGGLRVAGQSYDGSEGETKRKKDLSGSF